MRRKSKCGSYYYLPLYKVKFKNGSACFGDWFSLFSHFVDKFLEKRGFSLKEKKNSKTLPLLQNKKLKQKDHWSGDFFFITVSLQLFTTI